MEGERKHAVGRGDQKRRECSRFTTAFDACKSKDEKKKKDTNGRDSFFFSRSLLNCGWKSEGRERDEEAERVSA